VKIVLDIKTAHILRRPTYPDVVGLELKDGGEILAESISDAYSKLCAGRFDIEFRCPYGTAEKLLEELGLLSSVFDLYELPVMPKVPFSESVFATERKAAVGLVPKKPKPKLATVHRLDSKKKPKK
jgi:hypothetical protein